MGRIEKRKDIISRNEIEAVSLDPKEGNRFDSLPRKEEKRRLEHDKQIQAAVFNLLQDKKITIEHKDLQYHIEHIIVIKLARQLKDGTLTFEKYNEMKEKHRLKIKEKIRRREIEVYDFEKDVYS